MQTERKRTLVRVFTLVWSCEDIAYFASTPANDGTASVPRILVYSETAKDMKGLIKNFDL